MYRTHTCGELRISDAGQTVTLAGWAKTIRKFGSITFVDLRDRYGITQLFFNEAMNTLLEAQPLGREYVLEVKGTVIERSNKNLNIPTGEIEIEVKEYRILNASLTPPFTIEDDTDGGEELRMKYRYLDLRRDAVKKNLELRYKVSRAARNFLDSQHFMEVETPMLIKSTPEGARDFVVPSRMHEGQFYALPQSPQLFKQLLMVAGYDRYFQIVKCFRDEDLRADRQPEFTQIDCEMSFINQEDILNTFEAMTKHIFEDVKGITFAEDFPRMPYDEAMRDYGNDKPDIRFDMKLKELNEVVKGKGFPVFDDAALMIGIAAPGCSEYTRKQTDELTDWVKRPQIGMKGLVYIKCNADGTFKSSVDKFYNEEQLKQIAEVCGAKAGDLILILAGEQALTRKAISELRLEMGNRLGLRNPEVFKPLWVTDFPLFEYDAESDRYIACHHPFTSPKPEHLEWMKDKSKFADIKANAYDLVLNGTEIGGGSIRIFQKDIQEIMFDALGFTKEEANEKFGFLLSAFEYGTPPHGGIALGFDRLCALLGGHETIRDYIAFPKNNAGRDMMLDAPGPIDEKQKKELGIG
ncbi:MAG: aspartate--tRNA ligase [Chitinophagaceae bacterium]|nr:aspartate--tRNA ligase [Chitinophagaceae bacterium]